MSHSGLDSREAKERLIKGNEKYVATGSYNGNVSEELRVKTSEDGQFPYAVVITCADSRVIPEAVFSAGIGDIFDIRVAGNVIGDHAMGSVQYAVEHLGTNLVMVMGHKGCGAVAAALGPAVAGHISTITSIIKDAIGDIKDPDEASARNVKWAVEDIRAAMEAFELDPDREVEVIGGIYDIRTGKVDIICE